MTEQVKSVADGAEDGLVRQEGEPKVQPVFGESIAPAGEAGSVYLSGKVVRSNGASHRVLVSRLGDGGFRIEGAEGMRNGEKILLLFTDGPVIEAIVRWVVGNQAGAVPFG